MEGKTPLDEVLISSPSGWAYWLALVVTLQACIVMLQERFGPSFFLPSKVVPLFTPRVKCLYFDLQYRAVRVYDYHPPMPLPDSEAPEKSLGDCSICMDAIYVDPSLRLKASQVQEKSKGKGSNMSGEGERASLRMSATASASGFLSAVQMGVGGSSRKEYSLAPCHHLFVSCFPDKST